MLLEVKRYAHSIDSINKRLNYPRSKNCVLVLSVFALGFIHHPSPLQPFCSALCAEGLTHGCFSQTPLSTALLLDVVNEMSNEKC